MGYTHYCSLHLFEWQEKQEFKKKQELREKKLKRIYENTTNAEIHHNML